MSPEEERLFIEKLEAAGEVQIRAAVESGKRYGPGDSRRFVVSHWLELKKAGREETTLSVADRSASAAERSAVAAEGVAATAREALLTSRLAAVLSAIAIIVTVAFWFYGRP